MSGRIVDLDEHRRQVDRKAARRVRAEAVADWRELEEELDVAGLHAATELVRAWILSDVRARR
jgi:hypothetical protein